MRCRSLVSSRSRALAICPDVKGEGDTHVERCVGLHVCKLQRYCQGMLCFEVGDGIDVLVQVVLVQVHAASAEVSARPALPRPVAHLLCNRQVQRVVLYSLCIVPLDPATDSLSMELRRDHVLQIFSRGCS